MYINFWYPIVRSEDLDYEKPENGAFAIACPARRTSGNWVLEEIPRISNSIDRQASSDRPSVQAVG